MSEDKRAQGSGMIEQPRYSCAIGAEQTVVAIPRAVPILHSGPGCGTMQQFFFRRSSGYAGGGTAPCTNFGETDVVFGGTRKLRDNIENTYKILDTDLQVVLTGCTSGIVGDDVQSVVEEFQKQGRSIVWCETSGFKSNNLVAHSNVVNAIIDQYVDKFVEDNPPRSDASLVNVFASIPYQDQFWKPNLRELKRLLEGLGLRANILFGPFSDGVAEWQTIPRANFNILISPWFGEPIVQHLQDKYGQPYYQFEYLPIGGNATSEFLHGVTEFALEQGAGIDRAAADAFVDREERAFYEDLESLSTFFMEFRYGLPGYVHILHDASYVLGLCRFLLQEIGLVPTEQFIVDNTPKKYQQKILDTAAGFSDKRDIPIDFRPDAGAAQDVLRSLDEEGGGVLFGSAWDRELAREKHYIYVPVSVPATFRLPLATNYVGYTGGLHVIEDIYDKVLDTY